GGVLGALAVWCASWLIELPNLVLFLAALHGGCVAGTLRIRAPSAPESAAAVSAPTLEPRSILELLRKTPFLRHLGILVILSAATSALLDYVFSARAAAAFGTGQALLSFFALFWFVVSVLSFLFQVTLGRLAIAKLGVAANIAVLSGVTVLGSAIGLIVPGLTSTAVLRGAEAVHHNTLFRSAYELLYTPLGKARKRPTKALIDVGFDRFGTVVGSGIAILALAVAAQTSLPLLLAVVVVLAIAALPVVWRLRIDYRAALEEGLREGARGLDLPAIHRGSRLSAAEKKESVARDKLIERVEALRPGGLGQLSATQPSAPGPACEALRDPQPLIAQATELLSGDVERTRRALDVWPMSSKPVADFAIVLLAHEELHRDAVRALRRVAPRITGALVDALLDPAMDFVVRRRIARVLGSCRSQRAADGLLAAIRDERFEVRYECGRALLKLMHRTADIVVSRERIVEAIWAEREKSMIPVEDSAERDIHDSDDGAHASLADVLVRDRIDRSLEHVFTILSLHLEREPLRMAFRALHHEDVRHRGTALEYLHTILPADIRDAVWPLFGEPGPLSTARAAEEILADLVRATSPS
ncbi:MAG TPA: HEAT repeat domain-containing protein, partial [Polyangiaceae bacterium]|nr:HEAT repeat domain-containing protein [Polyangiaceae bacterium]